MQYLKGTLDMRLHIYYYMRSMQIGLAMWKIVGLPTSRYVFSDGEGAVSWNSRLQQTVAQSTMEAKHMVLNRCTKEAIWLRQLMKDISCVQEDATTIMCDNQGSMALAKNPTNRDRSKHIDVQHHFIRKRLKTTLLN